MRTRQFLLYLAFFLVAMASLSTGLGGWMDIIGRPIVLSREHAWNDGIFALLLAIFIVLALPYV
jgi:hypothetical protein